VKYCFLCQIALTTGLCAVLAAQGLASNIEIQRLHFGSWVVVNTMAPQSIVVGTDGSYSQSGGLVMLEAPVEGIYTILDLPEFATINSVTVTVLEDLQAGGQVFTMDDFNVIAPDADINGETTITIGGTASTTGGGSPYPDATYNGQIHLVFNL
jgi:hypothetical protein